MGFYPIFLEMSGRPCLVVGGGRVAERKVEGLLAAGASVTVVSPSLSPSLEALARDGRIRHVAREYQPGDLEGHDLALVAAPGIDVHDAAREGRGRAGWVNVADDPARCDFILPAVVRRGALTVAVSTGGASPALTRAIRDELEAYFTQDYGALTDVVADVRRALRRSSLVPDGEAWHAALDGTLRRLVAEGRCEEAKAYLLGRLGAG